MCTERIAPAIDPVDAVTRADAGSDPRLLAALQLRHQVRVGHVWPCETRHVDIARAERPVGSGGV